jgi:hypothetical protein
LSNTVALTNFFSFTETRLWSIRGNSRVKGNH